MINDVHRCVTNEESHTDLAVNHENKLLHHINVEAILLLNCSQDVRMLKRIKPHKLIDKKKKFQVNHTALLRSFHTYVYALKYTNQ